VVVSSLGLVTLLAGCSSGSLPTRVVGGPSDMGVRHGDLSILSGANSVAIARTSGSSSLYRVATASGNGSVPTVNDAHENVDVRLMGIGSGHGANLSVQLAPGVEWSIRLAGGASKERLDLSHLNVGHVAVAAGVSDLSIRMPARRTTSTISVAGGASAFDLIAPASVSVHIDFVGGAGEATLDGVRHSGLGGRSVLTSAGSAQSGTINVTCPGGIGAFTLTRD
jgi:hypothetical protein